MKDEIVEALIFAEVALEILLRGNNSVVAASR